MLPLYAGYPPPGVQGNAGLRFDKFFAEWNELGAWTGGGNEKPIPENAKSKWVIDFAKNKVGNGEQLTEYNARTEALVKHLQGAKFTATTQGRLVAGTGRSHPIEVGFAWHHTLGVPYIPGSGLKGIVKSWAEEWENRKLDDLLGVMERVGQVVFLDALPIGAVKLQADVMTPHYGEYYRRESPPGDWLSPNPIPFLTVADGQEFLFAVVPADPKHATCCTPAIELLEQALELLQQALAELGAGAKTAAGYGRFGAFKQERR